MSLQCQKCGRKFKEKRCFDQHMKRKNPCEKKIICLKCDKIFPCQADLTRHMSRKTPCDEEKEELDKKCSKCNKEFTNRSNMLRHEKSCVKETADIQTLMSMMETMSKKLSEIQGTGVVNITNNIQQNLTIDYKQVALIQFGHENLEKLDIQKIKRIILEHPDNFTPLMIEAIHSDPDLLENHNIYYDNRTSEIMIYTKLDNVTGWQSKPENVILLELVDKAVRYLKTHAIEQDIKPRSIEETVFLNNKHAITKVTKWDSPENIVAIKKSLTKVAENPEFMKMVEYHTSAVQEVTE